MEQAVELRTQLRKAGRGGDGEGSAAPDGGAAVPSYNDMVVKACGLALRDHPRANAAYRDGAFELYERVNVGIAVAAHDSLVVPTVFDADRKSLVEIAREARTLAERVRSRQITPAELSGGTFTVSNLGMYGVAGLLGDHQPAAGRDPRGRGAARGPGRPRRAGRPGLRMSIALTCDHRILYGAPAAEFLGSRPPAARAAAQPARLSAPFTGGAPTDRASRRNRRPALRLPPVPTSPAHRGGRAAASRAAAGRSASSPRRCPGG